MKVTFFFRKFNTGAYSIEELFGGIMQYLQDDKKAIESITIKVPFFSKSIFEILKNIIFTRRYQSKINHVTGDIHYVILGLSSKNKNILTIHDCALMYRFSKYSIDAENKSLFSKDFIAYHYSLHVISYENEHYPTEGAASPTFSILNLYPSFLQHVEIVSWD